MATDDIEKTLEDGIEIKEQQYVFALMGLDRAGRANQFVFVYKSLGKTYRSIGIYLHLAAHSQAWAQYNGVKILAFATDILVNRAVIVGTGKR
jgi:hypothetical protein